MSTVEFKNVQQQLAGEINAQDTDSIQLALVAGLQCLVICKLGDRRSGAAMRQLNSVGISTLKLSNGISGLSLLNRKQIENFGKAIAKIPFVFLTITSIEAQQFSREKMILEAVMERTIPVVEDPLYIVTQIRKTDDRQKT